MRKRKNNRPSNKNPKGAMYFEGIPPQLRRDFRSTLAKAGFSQKAALVEFMHAVVEGHWKFAQKV